MFNPLKLILDTNEKEVQRARKIFDKVDSLAPQMEERSYEDMRKRIAEMRDELKPLVDKIPRENRNSLVRVDPRNLPKYEIDVQSKLLGFMPEVYAMVREIMRRDFNKMHFPVQVIAGIILAQGQKLTELKTGEGKTQVFHLPIILYSLAGRGAQLVTVNDYLARRDGEYLGHVASRLGLSVGIIAPGNDAYKFIDDERVKELKGDEVYEQRKKIGAPALSQLDGLNLAKVSKHEAYACDITVGVNNEFGFDYLRDNMANSVAEIVQRELYFCIVDEADSILIDEARTPLIISALPEDTDSDKYKQFAQVARKLEEKEDYEMDHKTRTVMLTDAGIAKVEKILGVENVWSDYSLAHHIENALKAKALFLKDDHYIVKDGEILIVDQFTGRVMPGRRYSEGIHQAIEAKEGVEVQQESKTMATITFQNYFRLYKYLSGGSGTIMTEAEEFYKIYSLESVVIPTHRNVIREDASDVIYRNQELKYKAVVREVKERYDKGQPVLVGTTSVEKSELVSRLLDQEDVPHNVLNAKYHEREAQIVAKAGEKGAVTVATNMAGRGTDIPLGKGVKDLGGLAVVGTERHEARRIDNQLRGRSGRQGDPGYSRFYVALDDQIMRVLGGEIIDKMIGRFMQDDAPIEMGIISRQIETAQKRLEGMNFDIRKSLVEYDDVMNKQREIFYTRRRQLLSMLDDAVSNRPDEAKEDEAVRKEETRFELADKVKEIMQNEVNYIVSSHFNGDNKLSDEEQVDKLASHVLDLAPDQNIALAFDIKSSKVDGKLKDEIRGQKEDKVRDYIWHGVEQMVDAKVNELGEDFPVALRAITLDSMNRLWMEHLETMSDIRSGITLQAYAQRDPLVEYKTVGFQRFEELMYQIDSSVARRFLKITKVDRRQVQQPQEVELMTNEAQIEDILTGDREMLPEGEALDKAIGGSEQSLARTRQQLLHASGAGQTVRNDAKIGRNDPCPCGSGKKYKHCGLKNTPEHQQNMAKR